MDKGVNKRLGALRITQKLRIESTISAMSLAERNMNVYSAHQDAC